MKSRKIAGTSRRRKDNAADSDGITIRACHGIEEFEACVRVERAVWKSDDIDVVPIPLFVVASHTGGQVLGAFDGSALVGFTMAIAGWRGRKPFLHSHMTAVLDSYRNHGIGRRLKLFQREDALARGIDLVEWTFDPLVTKNAYFNFTSLGAVAKRYLPNAYGITTSPLHSSLPTDRLVAEWHLRSRRVLNALKARKPAAKFSKKVVRITIPSNIEEFKSTDPARARELQTKVRAEFTKWLGKRYVATAIEPSADGMDYVLEPGGAL
jgi:predicted GNAT superfamily acetyltransferase